MLLETVSPQTQVLGGSSAAEGLPETQLQEVRLERKGRDGVMVAGLPGTLEQTPASVVVPRVKGLGLQTCYHNNSS